jgi:probable phosphoglycerate mutase
VTALILIRHGETDWNRDRRIQGTTDIPLNDAGRAQARETAAALCARLDSALPLTVASSDLSRARETAEIIAEVLDADGPRVYPGLRERRYGEAEGMDVEDFRARWGDWHTAEVPGAEAWADLRERALAALSRAVQDHEHATGSTAATLIVVAHGALMREVIREATGGVLPPAGERLANGSAHDFVFEDGRLRLVAYAGLVA